MVGSLYRWLSLSRSIAKHGRHRLFLFLISRFLKIFPSVTAFRNELKFGRKHVWKVLYKDSSFHPDSLANMAATGNSCFRLIDFFPAYPIEPKLGRKHLWKVLYKYCYLHPDLLTNMAAIGNSCVWLGDF
jgi:hypothetical protein